MIDFVNLGEVKLAHFSVKEYLLSDRIKKSTASFFATNEHLAHSALAQTCIAYLLIFQQPGSVLYPVTTAGPFPLHLYAVEHTTSHLSSTRNDLCTAVQALLFSLFFPEGKALTHWIQMYDPTQPWLRVRASSHSTVVEVATPFYYACSLGLRHVAQRLLNNGLDVGTVGGHHGTALEATAYGGYVDVAELLLKNGADVNTQRGFYGSPLQAASIQGRTETAKLLLQHGADVKIDGRIHGTALHAAAQHGHPETVELLLRHGADVNLKGGVFGSALQAAAHRGHIQVVTLLLEYGANVDIKGGVLGTH